MPKKFDIKSLSTKELERISNTLNQLKRLYPNDLGIQKLNSTSEIDKAIRFIHTDDFVNLGARYGRQSLEGMMQMYINKEQYEICAQIRDAIKEKGL